MHLSLPHIPNGFTSFSNFTKNLAANTSLDDCAFGLRKRITMGMELRASRSSGRFFFISFCYKKKPFENVLPLDCKAFLAIGLQKLNICVY